LITLRSIKATPLTGPGGGAWMLQYTYDATLSAGLNLGVARTMLVLGALGGVCGAATLVVRRLLRGGATAYQRVDAGVVA
jgi:hypothetical protein